MKQKYFFSSVVLLATMMMALVPLRAQEAPPSCEWTISLQSDWGYGFFNNSIQVVDTVTGVPVDTITFNWNYSTSEAVTYVPGQYKLCWLWTGDSDEWVYEYLNTMHVMVMDYYGETVVDVRLDTVNLADIARFSYVCPSCLPPTQMSYVCVDSTSATLTWNNMGAGVTYQLTYGPEGFEEGTTVTTAGTSITLTGLTTGVRYEVYIGSLCGDGVSYRTGHFYFAPGPRKLGRIYVSANRQGDGTMPDGASWATAYYSIGDAQRNALLQANLYNNHPDIWVARGYYYENLTVHPSQHLYGGFVGNEPANYDLSLRRWQDDTNFTVIDGSWNGACLIQEVPFTAATASSFDGFLIGGGQVQQGTGGVALKAYTTLRNCIIENSRNMSYETEGNHGLFSVVGDPNNIITVAENCIFQSGMSFGSVIYVENARLDNCIVFRHSSTSTIVELGNGGSLRHCDLLNNDLYSQFDNARYLVTMAGSGATMVNSIVANNWIQDTAYNWSWMISNLVNTFNGVTYSALNGAVSGTGNISVDTNIVGSNAALHYLRFVNYENGDYRLNYGSACINAGTPIAGFCSTDLSGEPRVYGSAPDMGCYEYQGTRICSKPEWFSIEEQPAVGIITFYWNEPSVDSYELSYRVAGDESAAWTTVSGITGGRYTLTGLPEYTDYMVRLRAKCGSDYTEYTDTITFNSGCNNPVDPVSFNNAEYYNSRYPVAADYAFSGCYFIIKASELGNEHRTIHTIALQPYQMNTPLVRNWQIAFFTTNEESLSYDNLGNLGQGHPVFSGDVTVSGSWDWMNIPLTQPFEYDGLSNLVVAVLDTTGTASDIQSKFLIHGSSSNSCFYFYSNEPGNFRNAFFTSYRPDFYINGECDMSPCPRPKMHVDSVGETAIRVAFDRPLHDTPELQYSTDDGATWTTVVGLDATMETFTVTGLTGNTTYRLRLRCNCGADGNSIWVSLIQKTAPVRYQHIYVKADATGAGDGTTWENALTDINEALELARSSHDSWGGEYPDIRVAAGVYYGDSGSEDAFFVQDPVSIYGGFAGNEPDDYDLSQRNFEQNATILDGQHQRRVLKLNPRNNNWNIDFRPVYDGLTIRNGSSYQGAGIYVDHQVVLSNLHIENCYGTGDYDRGAALYFYSNGSLVTNTTITRCAAGYGTIHSVGNKFVDCDVTYCGLASQWYNSSYSCAGMYSNNDSVIGCRFMYDSCSGNVVQSNNSYFENCLIANNSYSSYYDYTVQSNNSTFVGCDIVNNSCSEYSNNPGIYLSYTTLANSIVWGNRSADPSATQLYDDYENTIVNTAVEGWTDDENGNIGLSSENMGTAVGVHYPCFVSPETGEYHLMGTSSCIDAGAGEYTSQSTDLSGTARIFGSDVDMGCYENHNETYCVAPQGITVLANSTVALFSWTLPDDVTAAQLEYRMAGADSWTVVQNVTATSYMVGDLLPLTTYEYRMKGICAEGTQGSYTPVRAFATECASGSQQFTLSESTDANTYIPIRLDSWDNNNYSFSEQIFLQSEIGSSGYIDTVRFRTANGSSVTRGVKVYIGHTARSGFVYGTGVVPLGQQQLVYQGPFVFAADAWVTIPLQTPFDYDGSSNLVLTVVDTTGTYFEDRNYFVVNYEGFNCAISSNSYEPINIDNSNNFNYWSNRNMVMFSKTCGNIGCVRPLLTVGEVTDESATVTCQTGANIELQYKADEASEYTPLTVTMHQTLSGLRQNTSYSVRARMVCGSGDTSNWRTLHFTTLPHNQSRYYVMAGATGNGTSWSDAAGDLAWTLDAATVSSKYYRQPVDVWVAQGTYYGKFSMADGINVYGGFEGNEPDNYNLNRRDFTAHASILDGQNADIVIYNPNQLNNVTEWDGFTVRNGKNTGGDGGGISVGENIIINHFTVEDCEAYTGGGIYIYGNRTRPSVIKNTIVTRCRASYRAGGIYSNQNRIENCEVSYCSTPYNNYTYDGAIYSNYDTVVNCRFIADTSYQYGAGHLNNSYVENCLFADNYTHYYSTLQMNYSKLVGCDVVNNKVEYNSSNPTAIYRSGSYTSADAVNCIVWGNRSLSNENAPQMNLDSVRYCAVEGGYAGTGNIALVADNNGAVEGAMYPLFAAPEDGDYRLLAGSPCVDAGSDADVRTTTDLKGSMRIYGDHVDMGCLENDGSIICVYPANLTAQVSSSAAAISWTKPQDALATQLDYRIEGSETWTTVQNLTGSTYLISGLQPSTTYEYRMKSYCDDDEASGYSAVKTFVTECSDGYSNAVVGDTMDLSNTVSYLPISSWNNYSVSQQIFLQSELGSGGIIDAIRFRQQSGEDNNRGLKIYMGHTDRTSYRSSNDIVTLPQMSLVFDGTVNVAMSDDGWLYIPLQNSFDYNGNDNIVLTVIDTTGSYVYDLSFYTIYDSYDSYGNYIYRSLHRADYYDPVGVSSDISYNMESYRNVVLFSKQCGNTGCARPLLAVDNVTDSSAMLSCELMAGTSIELQYKAAGESEYASLPLVGNQTLNHLRQNTTYEVRVRATCAGNEASLWRTVTFTTLPRQQSRFYVTMAGTGDGSSWTNATGDLDWALNSAAAGYEYFQQPVTVWVAEGTYQGSFAIREGVNVYGGFAGTEPAGYNLANRDLTAHATILDGQQQHRVLTQSAAFTRNTVVWDGFTVTRGRTSDYGGGIYLFGGVDIKNFKVTNCIANEGGGLYASGEGQVTITNSLFSGDSSYNSGAAIYASYADIENVLVCNNSSLNGTSGIYLNNNFTLTGATIVGNYTRYGSEALSANYYYYYYSNNSSVRNTIVWGNRNSYGTIGVNTMDRFYHCAIEGAPDSLQNGNLLLGSSNEGLYGPMFVRPTEEAGRAYSGGDWRLQQGSVCVNRGGAEYVTQTSDLDGHPRVQNGKVDMGCYESAYDSVALPEYGDIVYVKEEAAGTGDGTSWANATDDINFAQQIARSQGIHKVWVAQGVYYGNPDVSNGVFNVTPSVSVYGGFEGTEEADYDLSLRDFDAHASILDGGNRHRVLYQSESINTSDQVVWDGFTIRNGNATGNYDYGGGAYLQQGSALVNCTVTANHAYYGGGVYISGSANTVTIDGREYRNYNSRLVNCKIVNNTSDNYGGGVYNEGALVANCLVADNRANSMGGGVYNSSNGYVVNATIVANSITSEYGSGGGYCGYTGWYGNSYLANSVVWGNKKGYEVDNIGGGSWYGLNAIEGGITDSLSIINLESTNDGGDASKFYPRFIDPQHGDYTIHVTSPCVNYGDSLMAYYLPEVDLAGEPRRMGESLDLGCYETGSNSGCPSVVNVRAENITSSSALVLWTPMGDETSWSVVIRQEGENDATTQTVNTASIQLSDLSINRTYMVYVRAICEGAGISTYSIPAVFTTSCDPDMLTPLTDIESMTVVDGERTLQADNIFYSHSLNFSWASMSMATSYDFYFWKEGDEEPETPTLRKLTTAGVNDFAVPGFDNSHGAQFHWKVVAWNECISKSSETMTLQEAALPDLHVSNMDIEGRVAAGSTVTVHWTVTNDGQGSTPPGANWYDYIYITGHNGVGGGYLYYADETLLAQESRLQTLAPGESYQNSVQVTIPLEYVGNYFFFAMADQHCANGIDYTPAGDTVPPIPYNPSVTGYLTATTTSWPGACINSQVSEIHEGDNFFYMLKTVLPPPTPNLYVTQIQHPIDAFSGDTITFRYQVTNQGDAAAQGYWTDAIYITNEDTLVYSTALLLGTRYHNYSETPLAIEAVYGDSVTAVLPLQIDGTYHVYVVTNVENTLYESTYAGDNIRKSAQDIEITMAPTADLVVNSIVMESDQVSAAATYPLTYTVKNVGARDVVDEHWRDAVYISPYEEFNAATARRIGTLYNYRRSLAIDESYTETVSITIPDSIEGVRYIFVKTDVDNNVFEYVYDTNNVMRKATPVQISLPDLQVGWDSIPDGVEANQTVSLRWYVKNVGQGDIVGRYFRNGLTFYGQTLAQHSGNLTLAAGDSLLYTETLTLPCRGTDQVALVAKADIDNRIYETDVTNNSSSITLPVASPDLVATHLIVSDTVWSGTTVSAQWTLANRGSVAVDAMVTDRFYLGASGSYSPADSMGSYTRHVTLAAGDSIVETFNISIPNGMFGDFYVHQLVNAGGDVCEGSNGGNLNLALSNAVNVKLSPYPDLVISALEVPTSLNIGETFTVGYTTGNQGTGALAGKTVTTRFYLSPYATFSTSTATLIGDAVERMTIAVNDEVENSALLRIPTSVGSGSYFIYAVTDATNTVYEYTYENNNTTRTDGRVTVNVYPLDLTVSGIATPATVDWGANVTFTVTVTNNSSVPTLATYWNTQLILSQDSALHSTDTKIGTAIRYETLEGDSSYSVAFSTKMPYGLTSPAYLIALVDREHYNPDIDYDNNILIQRLMVNSVPTADLAVTNAVLLDEQVYSGQDARIAYTVTNVSEQPVTNASWTDKVFLSTNATYEVTDVEVGNTTKHDMTLAPGDSYTDTATFRVPLPQNGTFYLMARTNSGANFYESNMDNNLDTVRVTVILPQPGDLTVSDIFMDGNIVSGDTLHVSWKVKNIGNNTLAGNGLRSLAYLSTNITFDASDQLLGSVNSNEVSLIPGGEMVQQMQARLSGLSEGEYYVIVKTDVSRVFNEIRTDNNTGCSDYPLNFTLRNLPFNTPVGDTLYNNLSVDYKLNVDTNVDQTVRIWLQSADTASGAVNTIYVSHNDVGGGLGYDFSTLDQSTHNPELYIPATEAGYYGVNIQGSTPTAESQAVILEADILPFELRAVNPNHGGNTGRVTVMLTGSRFSPDMQVALTAADGTVLRPVSLICDNYYKAFATFDLAGQAVGVYDVSVTHPTEGTDTLVGGFYIETGMPENLYTNVIFPQSPRPNRLIVAMIEYGNMGNTDIVNPTVTFNSIAGTPVSLTVGGLADSATTTTIPLSVDGDMPNVLRPGVSGYTNIYINTTNNLTFFVERPTALSPSTTDVPVRPNSDTSYSEMIAVVLQPEGCEEDSNGSVTVKLPEGMNAADYYFSWKTVEGVIVGTTQTMTGLASGGYLVDVISNTDTTFSYSDYVYVDKVDTCNTLRVNITSTSYTDVCATPSVENYATAIGGVPPYTYSWTNRRYTVTGVGRYQISCRVVDAEGHVAYGNKELYLKNIECSVDPNEIKGPEGYDEEMHFVAASEKMNYTIGFENDPDFATAPATRVSIVYPVPQGQDIRSMRLSDFGFGDHTFSVPANSTTYTKRLDVSADLGIWVDVRAGIDIKNNRISWVFQSIDPATGSEPQSAQMGFLPVNDTLGSGEGFVSFLISPMEGRRTGDTVIAQATIVFDDNAPIPTNLWKNTFDAVAPTSSLQATVPIIDSNYCLFTFTATDDANGSGVDHVELYVSENEGAYEYFASAPADSMLRYTLIEGGIYSFVSVAVDHVGNREVLKTTPDTVINNSTAPRDILLTSSSFRENSTLNTVIGRLTTIDNDITKPFVYELVEGEGSTDNALFAIADGRLVTNATFNCNGRYQYSVRIRTTDVTDQSFEKVFMLTEIQENFPAATALNDAICQGESYTFGGHTQTTQGVYVDSLYTVMGCDSVVTLNLTVNPVYSIVDEQTACDSYTWIDGQSYTTSTNIPALPLQTVAGCDSTITLHLTVNNSSAGIDEQTACDSYTWIDGITYTANNTTAQYTLTNAANCDSTVTLNLIVNHSSSFVDVHSACDSYTWINGVTYTASTTTDTVMRINAVGCDSTVTLSLTIRYSSAFVDEQTACDSFTWPLNGQTYTASNTTDTVMRVNAADCDSTITLHLTLHVSTTGIDEQTACDSYTWINGVTYTASNTTDTAHIINIAGCDSTVTLHLTLNVSSAGIDEQTACDSYTWIDGITYTTNNNTAQHTLTNAAGCDSTVTLNLTIRYSSAYVDEQVACDTYTWPLNGQTYTSSNTTDTVMRINTVGCDSTVTLHLTINYSAEITVTETAEGSYTWNDTTYTESGTYIWNGTTIAGCDSTVTLILVIENVGIPTVNDPSVRVYPNPTRGIVIVEADGLTSIEVYDLVGRKVATYESTEKIDFSTFSAGTYTLRIRHAAGITLKRVVRSN